MSQRDLDQAKILVVGGAGFVGSNLCRSLLIEAMPDRLIIVDNLLSAESANIPTGKGVEFLHGSINDDRLLAALPDDLDYVFHLATYHGNQSSIHDPLADHENNTLTTLKLLERLKGIRNLKRVVYASAGCTVAQKTFDTASATTESDSVSLYLDSPYQISKIIGEFYGNYYFTRYAVPFVKARFQNVYGPGEILGAGQWRGTPATVWRNVIPTFIWKALCGESLPIDNGGIATRDFIYVADIVSGLIACATKGKPGEVYNLASGVETSIKELADLILELTGSVAGVALHPKRNWDRSGKRYGDTTKTQSELGFVADVSLRAGLQQTIAWTREYRDMIQQTMNRHARLMSKVSPL